MMKEDYGWRNVCKGVCYLGAFFFIVVVFTEIEAGFNSPPPPSPQTGISAQAWLALIKGIGAAVLAYVFVKAAGFISIETNQTVQEQPDQPIENRANSNKRIAYKAIMARSEDGKFTDAFVLAFVREGHKGHIVQPELGQYFDYRKAQDKADSLNAELGLGKMRARRLTSRWSR